MDRFDIYYEQEDEHITLEKHFHDKGDFIYYIDLEPILRWINSLPDCKECKDASYPEYKPLFNATCAKCLINFKNNKPDMEL